MATPDLKPCPVCGNQEPEYKSELVHEYKTYYNIYYNAVYVACKCGCRTKSYIENGRYAARKAWNRRAGDEEA